MIPTGRSVLSSEEVISVSCEGESLDAGGETGLGGLDRAEEGWVDLEERLC